MLLRWKHREMELDRAVLIQELSSAGDVVNDLRLRLLCTVQEASLTAWWFVFIAQLCSSLLRDGTACNMHKSK